MIVSLIALTIAIIALICSLISLRKAKIIKLEPSVSYIYEKRDLINGETRIQAETKDLSIDNQIAISRGTDELKKTNLH